MKNNITLARLRGEIRAIKEIGRKPLQEVTAAGSSLFLLLPSQEVTDQLVQVYLDSFETTHRILHVPTFCAEYEKLWAAPQNARPAFVAILLGVLAVVCCIPDRTSFNYVGCCCKTRETAHSWAVQACDAWVGLQSSKHATIDIFQIKCLSFLAKKVNFIKIKREWESAGSLQRTAMAAGLHREPSHHDGKVTAYEREMKRRLWATIVETELQASIDRGMPVSFMDWQYNTEAPLNIDDEDFNEFSEQLPISKPSSQFTRTSFQHISRKSLSLRIELTSLINSPGYHIQHEEVLQYDGRIMECLDALHDWTECGAHGAQSAMLSRSPYLLMSFQLRRFLLLLHRPFAQRAPQNSRYSYSRLACINAAMTILKDYSCLEHTTNIIMRLMGDDLYNAALNICFDLCNSDFKRGKRLVSRYSRLHADTIAAS